jgi:drug/metabolite transporter (DMT)-like permease
MGQMPSLLATTAWSLILGGMPLLLASSIAERSETTTWNITFVSQLLFLAIVGTALASAVWYWLVQRDDIGRLTMYLFLVPVVGLTIATLVFDEPIGVLEGTGVTLTIVGIGAAVLESRREVVAHIDGGSHAVVVTAD